jgi:hypothetical protein
MPCYTTVRTQIRDLSLAILGGDDRPARPVHLLPTAPGRLALPQKRSPAPRLGVGDGGRRQSLAGGGPRPGYLARPGLG